MVDDYVEYDELGLLRVRCMLCGTIVGERRFIQMPNPGGGEDMQVMTFKRLSNWTQPQKVAVNLDGVDGYVEPIICKNHEGVSLNTKSIINKIMQGMKAEVENTSTRDQVEKNKSLSTISKLRVK